MPFSRQAERDAVRALARSRGAAAVLVLLDLTLGEARRRVAAAGRHEAADRSTGLVDDVAARFAPPDASVVVLDGRRPRAELVAAVRTAMDAARADVGRIVDA